MAPTPTTTDAFNAVADASRRQLLDALGTGEATVGELVDRLRLTQPQVSKHLAVLRAVGLVSVRVDGRHRWYRVNGAALQPIHDWVRTFERTWNTRLDRLDDLLAELQSQENEHEQHAWQPSRLGRDHPAVRHRDPHHPPVRRTRRPGLQGRDHTGTRSAVVGVRHVGVARLRDRPAGRRPMALRHPGGRHGGRLPRRVPARSTPRTDWCRPRSTRVRPTRIRTTRR